MSDFNHPTGRQIAAARALLGIGQAKLAALANVSAPTLRRMEASQGLASGYPNNIAAVRTALEQAGIQFLADGDVATGPGVALRS
jgi:hypothetical protein